MSVDFYKEFGELGYLANYSLYGFLKNGIYYPTAEHYYQSEKFDDVLLKEKIIQAKTPHEAASIGRDRNNIRRENFTNIKLDVMYEGVLEKFLQNSDIRSKLIETGKQEIREMTVKENYWGMGPKLDGKNEFGRILMKVREEVKDFVLRDMIQKCKNRNVYVLGHSHPDWDSVVSSLILTRILKSYGLKVTFAVSDENFVEKELVHDFLHDEYVVFDDSSDKYFILVDHNNLEGIPKDKVIGAIDHHRITGEVENLIEIEYASTALLIYDLFKGRYDFNDEEKFLIGLTVLTDTEYLTSSRFRLEDKLLYEELDLTVDVEDYQKKYFKTTDFSRKISDNFKDNYKEYVVDDSPIRRSLISSYKADRLQYYSQYVHEMRSQDIDLLIWCDYEEKKTLVVYHDQEFSFPYFTTSTNLVIDFLKSKNYL